MPIATTEALPVPPRFKWLKRVALAATGVAAVMIGTRLWWGHHADRKLAAMYADFTARGEPIRPADFQTPPVPDTENAAFYYTRAAAAVDPVNDVPAASTLNYPDFLPYPPAWHRMADKAVAANAKVYPDARKARELSAVDWAVSLKTPVWTNLAYPGLGAQRGLANVLGDTALHAHFHQNDAAALEYIADARAQARAVERVPFLVHHFVAIGIDALAVNRLQTMAGGLQIAGQPGGAPPGAATWQQVQAMIADLLDDRPYAEARHRALQGERMILVDYAAWRQRDAWLLRPMHELDCVRILDRMRPLMEAASATSLPAARAALTTGQPALPTFRFSELYSQNIGGYDRTLVTDFRMITDRRITALALATRLHKVDNGRYPARLDALVPKYLASLPADPGSPTGAPFGYILANNGTRPVAYSVGEDGTDETRGEAGLPAFTVWGWQGRTTDQYRDLSQWMPAAPPPGFDESTQTIKDQNEEPDE